MQLQIRNLGRIGYQEALDLQYSLVEQRQQGQIPDTLLLLEHDPVVTLGKRGRDSDMLLPEEELRRRGVEIARIDRGGQATYHGPGQLVGYPIIDLANHQRRVKQFVRNLETVLIRLLTEGYGISAATEEGHVGVWVAERKIASIGISIHRAVTMHGFALNVNTNLDYFSLIVPCGMQNCPVTSIEKELGRSVSLEGAGELAGRTFARVYGYGEIGNVRDSADEAAGKRT
jgi:lipoyl(octanoyl) transferase